MKSKAIGLRIPAPLWEQIAEFGCENFPKPDSERDFDITATLLELIHKGLGNDNIEQVDEQTVKRTVEELVNQNVKQIVKQQLETQLNTLLNREEFKTAISSIRKEIEPLLETEKQMQELLGK